MTLLRRCFVDEQLATRSVVFFRHFVERNDDCFAAGACFFDQGVGDALGELALLVSRAAFEHRDLDERH